MSESRSSEEGIDTKGNGVRRDGQSPHPLPDDREQLLDAVSNPRRRALIRLVDAEGVTTIGEAAERIAVREAGPEFDTDERKRVYVAIYQTHGDRLADAGIVEWDRDVLAPGERLEDAIALLDVLESESLVESDPDGLVDRLRRTFRVTEGSA